MKPTFLTLVSCVLTAGLAAAQIEPIVVPGAEGTIPLSVTIIAGAGEGIAQAAGESARDSDGVLVLPMPGSDHALRTQRWKSASDITWIVPADSTGSGCSRC